MKSSELISILHKKYNYLSYNDVKDIFDCIFDFIKVQMKNKNRIEIRGFGIFEAKIYKEKVSFNPKTLEYNKLEARVIPFYKASIILKQRINNQTIK